MRINIGVVVLIAASPHAGIDSNTHSPLHERLPKPAPLCSKFANMEVAGLVLGALPMALYAIDNYHRCLQLGKDYVRFRQTIMLIRSHIFVQQEQLRITLHAIGLPINPTRKELETRLRTLYPDKYDRFIDIISHMEQLLAKLIEDLDVDQNGKVCRLPCSG